MPLTAVNVTENTKIPTRTSRPAPSASGPSSIPGDRVEGVFECFLASIEDHTFQGERFVRCKHGAGDDGEVWDDRPPYLPSVEYESERVKVESTYTP